MARNPNQLVSVPRAASACGVTRQALHRAIDAGEVPAYRPGAQRRVRMADALKWLESRHEAAGAVEELPPLPAGARELMA